VEHRIELQLVDVQDVGMWLERVMRAYGLYVLLLGGVQGRLLYALTFMYLTICCSVVVMLGSFGEGLMALLEFMYPMFHKGWASKPGEVAQA
jgi:hypothetical protein